MRRRGAVRAVALGGTALVVSGLLAACSASDEGGSVPKPRGEITFGVLAPLSGDMTERGQDLVDGAQLAAAEINDQGGVLGRQVRLAVEDGGCAPATGAQGATRLAAKNVVAVIGGLCEDAAVAAAKTADATPFLVSSARADQLIEAGLPLAFPMEGTVHQEAMAAVHWMGYRSPQRVAVLGDGSPASQQLSELVTDRIKADGLTVSMRSAGTKDPDLAELTRAVTDAEADFVYWTGAAEPGGRLLTAPTPGRLHQLLHGLLGVGQPGVSAGRGQGGRGCLPHHGRGPTAASGGGGMGRAFQGPLPTGPGP